MIYRLNLQKHLAEATEDIQCIQVSPESLFHVDLSKFIIFKLHQIISSFF